MRDDWVAGTESRRQSSGCIIKNSNIGLDIEKAYASVAEARTGPF